MYDGVRQLSETVTSGFVGEIALVWGCGRRQRKGRSFANCRHNRILICRNGITIGSISARPSGRPPLRKSLRIQLGLQSFKSEPGEPSGPPVVLKIKTPVRRAQPGKREHPDPNSGRRNSVASETRPPPRNSIALLLRLLPRRRAAAPGAVPTGKQDYSQ